MAAPDVEVSRFKQLIKAAHKLGAQLTLYASATTTRCVCRNGCGAAGNARATSRAAAFPSS